MGYDTYYSLEINQATAQQAKQILAYMEKQEEMEYAFNLEDIASEISKKLDKVSLVGNKISNYFVGGSECCPWYENDVDMIELSRKFPSVLFVLHGEGEKHGDLWRTYYRDERLQHAPAKITYDEFNVAELKPLEDAERQ